MSSATYSCTEISAGKWVPDEVVRNADAPLQPFSEATEFATDKVLLRRERDVAADVFGTGWSTSSTPSTLWDDDASDPITDVEVGREALVGLIGREPNVMVVGRNAYTDLLHHPDLLDRIKYTQTGILTQQLLAQLFSVEKLLVGNAIYNTGAEGATESYSFIWGKHAFLGYVPAAAGLLQPAAGYTFVWGTRSAETIRDEKRKAYLVRVAMHYDTKVVASDAGYLFKSCVA